VNVSNLDLSFLIKGFQQAVLNIPETRDLNKKIGYSIYELVASSFAMMYFQDPSLDYFQQKMKDSMNKSNLESMFGIKNIPKAKRIRTFLDQVDPEYFRSAFTDVLKKIDQTKNLEQFKYKGKFLCPIDGSQYFKTKSESISCKHCLVKNHRNGTKTFSHSVVLPIIAHPDLPHVLPLFPEEIKNEDGTKKQDCEINASKRLIPKLKQNYPDYEFVILADALYAKEPFMKLILEHNYDFALVVTEKYNKGFMEEVQRRKNSKRLKSIEFQKNNKKYKYEWGSEIGFKKYGQTITLNYMGLTISNIQSGEQTYKNTWITNIDINEDNIHELVSIARSKWKVENEGFNILKNHNYEMEHNYGHGKENLAFNNFLLTLLAFLYHQAHELGYKQYKDLRVKKQTKKNFWDSLKAATRSILFDSWIDLISFLLEPPNEKLKFDPITRKLIPIPT